MATHSADELRHAGQVVAAAVRAAAGRSDPPDPADPAPVEVVEQAVA
jgi:hypothetical protein